MIKNNAEKKKNRYKTKTAGASLTFTVITGIIPTNERCVLSREMQDLLTTVPNMTVMIKAIGQFGRSIYMILCKYTKDDYYMQTYACWKYVKKLSVWANIWAAPGEGSSSHMRSVRVHRSNQGLPFSAYGIIGYLMICIRSVKVLIKKCAFTDWPRSRLFPYAPKIRFHMVRLVCIIQNMRSLI